MSDCVYYAFAEALRYSHKQTRAGSYPLFRLLKAALGVPSGIPAVVAPLVIKCLASYNGVDVRVGVHPWIYDLGFASRGRYYADPGVTPRWEQRWVARHTCYGNLPLSDGPAIYLDVERQHALFCINRPSFFCEMSFEISKQ